MDKIKRANLDSSSVSKGQIILNKYLLGLILVSVIVGIFFLTRSGTSQVFDFAFGGQPKIVDKTGKVNVLLLGISGPGHDGPNLTDTIMLASYDYQTKTVDLISLPRDLWLDNRQAKVNALYQIGINQKSDQPNYPLKFVEGEIGGILGVNILYAIRLDFSGFTKSVDLVGGIDVNIPATFEDNQYPLEGHENDLCGKTETEMNIPDDQAKTLGVDPGKHKTLLDEKGQVATVSAAIDGALVYSPEQVLNYFPCRFDDLIFSAGLNHMNGETALKYARSRHGGNAQGSDFARSKRQQQVLQAFRAKVLSANTLTDPQKVTELIKTFGRSVDTDIPSDQYLEFIKIAKDIKSTNAFVIDDAGKPPLLVNPPIGKYGGAWVLTPPNNDFSIIKDYVAKALAGTIDSTGSAKITGTK